MEGTLVVDLSAGCSVLYAKTFVVVEQDDPLASCFEKRTFRGWRYAFCSPCERGGAIQLDEEHGGF